MELQNGRPTDTTGRLDREIRTYDFLDKLGIEYQRIDHEAAFTMEQVIAKLAVLVRNLEPKQGRIRAEHEFWNEK